MPQLDESWQPNISEILLRFEFKEIPAGYTGPALNIELIGSLRKIFWPPLIGLIAGAMENRVPIFLVVPGRPGHVAGSTFLNDGLAKAHASGQLNLVMNELLGALEACVNHPKEEIVLDQD